MGLSMTVKETALAVSQNSLQKKKKKTKRNVYRRADGHKAASVPPRGPVRRSRRVAGEEAPGVESQDTHLESLFQPKYEEETYGVKHVRALGRCHEPWELFVDGYDAQGNRIYDKAAGLTCHQCRQKTLGKRTSCSTCQSLQGVFCGDCLYMRYGENINEVSCNPSWVCPPCRDLCNCSFHRSKRGWCPTGTLYRKSIAEGYASVAHFLVLTQLDGEEARQTAKALGWTGPQEISMSSMKTR